MQFKKADKKDISLTGVNILAVCLEIDGFCYTKRFNKMHFKAIIEQG